MMNKEMIKKVLQELAVKPFGKKAIIDYDLDEMAYAIERICAQYKIDPRLCLAQGILESHFGCNPEAVRSRKTNNIFNYGNMDDGRNITFKSYEDGLRTYCRMMAMNYCWRNEGTIVTPEMMIKHDFTRPQGGRYATAVNYTKDIAKIVAKIDKIRKENG